MSDKNYDFKMTVHKSVDFMKVRDVCAALELIGYACVIDDMGNIFITYTGRPCEKE